MNKKLNIKVEPKGEGFMYTGTKEDLEELLKRFYEINLEEGHISEEDFNLVTKEWKDKLY